MVLDSGLQSCSREMSSSTVRGFASRHKKVPPQKNVVPPPASDGGSGSSASRRLSGSSGAGRNVVPPPASDGGSGSSASRRLSGSSGAGRNVVPPSDGGSGSSASRRLSGCSLYMGTCSWMRRSESSVTINSTGSPGGRIRSSGSLPSISRAKKKTTSCLLVALRPANVEQEREKFFLSNYTHNPHFLYEEPLPLSVLEKYSRSSDQFLPQALRILNLVISKYGNYENFESITGGKLLRKSQIWASCRRYMQKEGCSGEVVVQLTEDLLSQAVMTTENSRPTLTINLLGARQHWLEGVLRHEIGCFSKDQIYLDGILRILRHRRSIDFRLLTSLGKVSFEDVAGLQRFAELDNARLPHFMQDTERYHQHLLHIMETNQLDDEELQTLLPE